MVPLEHLIAINDEVAAMVRAGVPLELGLRQAASDLPGRLRRISSDLAAALNRGESLPEALDRCGHEFPPVYKAIVEAGLRGRSLPRALEAVTGFAKASLELRRQLSLALIYPLIVVGAAYALFVAFLVSIEPLWIETLSGFRIEVPWSLAVLGWLRETLPWWVATVPVVVVVALGIWWWREWRTAFGGGGLLGRLVFWPVQVANFAELLGILVEQQVPLPEAVPLAAQATGERFRKQCGQVTERIAAGQPLSHRAFPHQGPSPFPPLLRWLLQATESSPTLAAALQQAAETYRSKAASRAEWVKITLPLFITLVIGGGATLLYSLTLFVPLTGFLTQLATE